MTEDSNAKEQQLEGIEVEKVADYSQFETDPGKEEQPESEPVQEEQPFEDSSEQPTDGSDEKYKELQADYTRKAQRLAELERQLAEKEVEADDSLEADPEIENLKKLMRDMGAVFKDDIEARDKALEDQKALDKFIAENPHYKDSRTALELMGQNSNKSWEDLALLIPTTERRTSAPIIGQETPKTREDEKRVDLNSVNSQKELEELLQKQGVKTGNLYRTK